MNVKELIDQLSSQDLEKMVVVSGYEGGYAEVDSVGTIPLKLNVNSVWYYGPHEDVKPEEAETVAVIIG